MWTLSVKICLLSVAVVLLCCASEGNLAGPVVPCKCNGNFYSRAIQRFKKCYEQIPRDNCDHAFMFFQGKYLRCVKPNAEWLTQKMKKENFTCPPDLKLEK